jgi:hypothetical protein
MAAEFIRLLGFAYRSIGEGRGVPIPLFIVEYLGSSGSLLRLGGFSPREIGSR